MNLKPIIFLPALLLLVGCFAPPKRHAWQISREKLAQIHDSATWPQLSTNDYVRVPDSVREAAVALLEEIPFVPLDPSQLSDFAPGLSIGAGQPYLVRGVSFSPPPDFTTAQFNSDTGRLLVQQFTYNGEMLMPFRWIAEPNALVVILSREPTQVYPDAILGGDWIFFGRDWTSLDRR